MGKGLALLFSVLAVAAQGQLYTPVDVGTVANDKTGDPLRKAFQKINANWANLYGTTLSSNAIWHLAQLSAGTNPVGVNAFQGRKGNVVLQAGDVTGALGYTPAGTNLVGPSSAGLMAGLPGDASLVYNGIGEWVTQSSGTDGTGSPGTAATIGIGSVSTLAPGAAATVQNTGTSNNAVLVFGIPQGANGPQGPAGPQGPQGPTGTPLGPDMTLAGQVQAANFVMVPTLTTYSAIIALDFSKSGSLWIPLSGNITFTSANLGAGRGITIRIDAGASDRTISCPTWHFISGAQAISLSAGKVGLLSVVAYDGTDANCVATWASE